MSSSATFTASRPYWKYDAIPDERSRETPAAWTTNPALLAECQDDNGQWWLYAIKQFPPREPTWRKCT